MEAVRLADRIAIMKDGMLVQVGTPQDIVLNPANEYVAEFVKEAPRTRIIKVDQLMEPVLEEATTDSTPEAAVLQPDMTLEDVLVLGAEQGNVYPVKNAEGKTVGMITPERLAGALSGYK